MMIKEIEKASANLKRLKKRIIMHREGCKDWKSDTPCWDCHWGLVGDAIEPAIRVLDMIPRKE